MSEAIIKKLQAANNHPKTEVGEVKPTYTGQQFIANYDKIAKLQTATDNAKLEMITTKTTYDDSLQRLNAAKELLRNMDPEDQAKIQVNDTKLPELIDMHAAATEAYKGAKSRFETNARYLELFKAKA